MIPRPVRGLPSRHQVYDHLADWFTSGATTRTRNTTAEADAARAHLASVLHLDDPDWPAVVAAVREVTLHRDVAVQGLNLARMGLAAVVGDEEQTGVRVEVVS